MRKCYLISALPRLLPYLHDIFMPFLELLLILPYNQVFQWPGSKSLQTLPFPQEPCFASLISQTQFCFFFKFLIYLWLCWVFVSVQGLSLVAVSGGHSSSRCAGLSLSRPLLLRSTGSRRAGSVVVACGPSCSAACGILPDQGSNPCPLHWQADSQPLRHQGSPRPSFYFSDLDEVDAGSWQVKALFTRLFRLWTTSLVDLQLGYSLVYEA